MATRQRKPIDSDRRSARSSAGPPQEAHRSSAEPVSVPPSSSVPRRIAVAASLALALLAVAAYSEVRQLQFVPLDDQGYVYENPHVTAGLTWAGLRWALTSVEQANWHPLTWLSHMADVQWFGLDAGYHHLTNLVIHTLNTVLLFLLLARTTGASGRSACVAALFAVHPLHVESVAWVAERKDVLSACFWLLTMAAYARYARRPRPGRYAAVVAGLSLGLLSKPMLVTLPCALLLFDVWPLGRFSFGDAEAAGARGGQREAVLALIREKIPLVALVAGSIAITLIAQSAGGAVRSMERVPIGARLATAPTSYVAYLVKAAWPSGLAVFYPYDQAIPAWQWGAALALLAAVTWLVVRARRRRPYLLVGWFWYLGTLVPVIGLVQVGSQSMADRYTYVPLIGIFVMAVWGAADLLARWPARRVVLPAAAAAVLVACTIATRAQVRHWQNAWTLWTHALAATRDNEPAHVAVGALLAMQNRTDEAVGHFREAVRIAPESAAAHRALGRALLELRQFDEAVAHLSRAVRYQPAYADAQSDLGEALAALGRPGDAIPRYAEALRLDPNRAATRRSLGLALLLAGREDDAILEFQHALRLQPGTPATQNDLGLALMAAGRATEAKEHFAEALRLAPAFAEAHDNLGFALAAEGRAAEALPHLAEAVRLKPDFETARLHLGMALGAAGRLDEAAREFREVLRLNPHNADAARLLAMASARSGGRS